MSDYGAIAFKNGKLISTDMFTPMIEMVGWEDTERDTYHNYEANKDVPLNLVDEYFAYIGDKDVTLAFYECKIAIIERYKDGTFGYHYEWFDCTNYTWSKWESGYLGRDGKTKAKVTKRNGYYVCKWEYKGDKYKVYFGYGVDLGYYEKYHMVNYYRSLEYIFEQFKDKLHDWKHKYHRKKKEKEKINENEI